MRALAAAQTHAQAAEIIGSDRVGPDHHALAPATTVRVAREFHDDEVAPDTAVPEPDHAASATVVQPPLLSRLAQDHRALPLRPPRQRRRGHDDQPEGESQDPTRAGLQQGKQGRAVEGEAEAKEKPGRDGAEINAPGG